MLKGFEDGKILNHMEDGNLIWIGHYIDHELVINFEADCANSSFYPVPKLFIRRIGGHEMWGAIHSAELGDGTHECENPEYACAMVKILIEQPSIIEGMCNKYNGTKENRNL